MVCFFNSVIVLGYTNSRANKEYTLRCCKNQLYQSASLRGSCCRSISPGMPYTGLSMILNDSTEVFDEAV